MDIAKQEGIIDSGHGTKSLVRDVIERGTSTFPFNSSNISRKPRTKRMRKSNGGEAISIPKKKLDSDVFDKYLVWVTVKWFMMEKEQHQNYDLVSKYKFSGRKTWKSFSEDKKRPFAYFDSLWFSLYRTSVKDKVLTWIKKENIFSKAYVFVPIVCW